MQKEAVPRFLHVASKVVVLLPNQTSPDTKLFIVQKGTCSHYHKKSGSMLAGSTCPKTASASQWNHIHLVSYRNPVSWCFPKSRYQMLLHIRQRRAGKAWHHNQTPFVVIHCPLTQVVWEEPAQKSRGKRLHLAKGVAKRGVPQSRAGPLSSSYFLLLFCTSHPKWTPS